MLRDCTKAVINRADKNGKSSAGRKTVTRFHRFSFSDKEVDLHTIDKQNDDLYNCSKHQTLVDLHKSDCENHPPGQSHRREGRSQAMSFKEEEIVSEVSARCNYKQHVKEQLREADRSLEAYRDYNERLKSKRVALKLKERSIYEKQRNLLDEVSQLNENSKQLSNFSSQMQLDLIEHNSHLPSTIEVSQFSHHLHEQLAQQLSSMKQASITFPEKNLTVFQEETAELHRTLATKIADIFRLERDLAQKDQLIAQKDSLIQHKDSLITALTTQVTTLSSCKQEDGQRTPSKIDLHYACIAHQQAYTLRIEHLEETIREKSLQISDLSARVLDLQSELKRTFITNASLALLPSKTPQALNFSHSNIAHNPSEDSFRDTQRINKQSSHPSLYVESCHSQDSSSQALSSREYKLPHNIQALRSLSQTCYQTGEVVRSNRAVSLNQASSNLYNQQTSSRSQTILPSLFPKQPLHLQVSYR